MCGLPTETDADLRAILDLGHRSWQAARDAGNKSFRITVSVFAARAQAAHPVRVAAQVDTRELNRRSACCARRSR